MVRRFHDFAAAEDAVQEAALAAAIEWPREPAVVSEKDASHPDFDPAFHLTPSFGPFR